MEFGEVLVSLISVVCVIGLPLILAILVMTKNASARHAERMAMIEKGMVWEEPQKWTNKYNALRNGLLMIGLSFGALIGLWQRDLFANGTSDFLVFIFSILGGGLAFIIYFFLVRRMSATDNS